MLKKLIEKFNHLNETKRALIESGIKYGITVGVGWGILKSIEWVFLSSFITLFLADFFLRKHLFLSKKRWIWNLAWGIVGFLSFLISETGNHLVSALMTFHMILSNRLMFYKDQNRAIETMDEYYDALFINTIKKVPLKVYHYTFISYCKSAVFFYKVRNFFHIGKKF